MSMTEDQVLVVNQGLTGSMHDFWDPLIYDYP